MEGGCLLTPQIVKTVETNFFSSVYNYIYYIYVYINLFLHRYSVSIVLIVHLHTIVLAVVTLQGVVLACTTMVWFQLQGHNGCIPMEGEIVYTPGTVTYWASSTSPLYN